MNRETGVYTLLLAGSLGLAYWASLPYEDKGQRKAVVDLEAAQIARLEFISDDVSTTAVAKDGDRYWITMTKKDTPPETFLTSVKMKDLLTQLHPLEAQRVIGKSSMEELKEFGISDSTKVLTIKGRDDKKLLELKVGKQAYGSRNVFALNLGSNDVLLLSGDLFTDFEKADLRLYERQITNILIEDVQKVEIKTASQNKKFDHTKRDDKGQLMWSEDREGASGNASMRSWMERLDRLRLLGYASDEEEKQLATVEPFLTVELTGNADKKTLLQFKKTTVGAETLYWVQSDYLKAHGKLTANRMEPIEKDLSSVF